METGCKCKGPALRSYAHAAHIKNSSLPSLPAGARQITAKEARILRLKKLRVYEKYNVHGSHGGPSTCSTLNVACDLYSTLSPEYVAAIVADYERSIRARLKKQHVKNLLALKRFAPDWRQDRWSGWYIVALKPGVVQSPEGYDQLIREVTLENVHGTTRTVCVIEDDNGTFQRAVHLDGLQSVLDFEVPERARREYFIRQGDWYFFPVADPLSAEWTIGEMCTELLTNTRHKITGYKIRAGRADTREWELRTIYAPGSRITAPDHPALTLRTWCEAESARGFGD